MDKVFAVELWESYVGRGAPSNASGRKTGYGRTREEAHVNADHWANQSAWARCRRVTVSDLGPRGVTTRDEEIAWEVCGMDDQECAELIDAGKFATAILRSLTAGEV